MLSCTVLEFISPYTAAWNFKELRTLERVLFKLLLVCGVCLALAQAAFAAGQPYYGGFSYFGTKSYMVPERDLIFRADYLIKQVDRTAELQGQRELTFEDAGHGKRIYMGTSSSPDWDWEWGYVDLGKTSGSYNGLVSGSFNSAEMTTDAKAEGWFLNVQFSPEIYDSLEATVKLGVLRWDGSKYSRLYPRDPDFPFEEYYETVAGIDEFYGVGLLYTANERWKIRLDADRYNLGDEHIDTIGISAQFWFNGRLLNNIFDY